MSRGFPTIPGKRRDDTMTGFHSSSKLDEFKAPPDGGHDSVRELQRERR